ncbi:hypothetical protein DH2020_001822 [Rehmannia glutinosa]|uniref:Reverse transcriptase n=1 Tax=Rehmannia glutinosa TaxID=99300 RepID=A0ABR0XS43_REHGL
MIWDSTIQVYLDKRACGDRNIQERLDRCFANISWVSRFPDYKIEHQMRIASDHCPILLTWSGKGRRNPPRKKRPFKFEKMWLQDESCTPYIIKTWGDQSHHNTPEFIREKIQQLGASLRTWESSHFGNVSHQLCKSREQLQEIQQLAPTDDNIAAIKILEEKIYTLMKREETMWYQRARVNWLKDGDKNTAFFHRVANGRNKRNSIERIKREDGMTTSKMRRASAEVLKQYFVPYSRPLLGRIITEQLCMDPIVTKLKMRS